MAAFLWGALTSIIAAALGMRIAVYANARTTVLCAKGYAPGFTAAFRGGAVMGFGLTSLGVFSVLAVHPSIMAPVGPHVYIDANANTQMTHIHPAFISVRAPTCEGVETFKAFMSLDLPTRDFQCAQDGCFMATAALRAL